MKKNKPIKVLFVEDSVDDVQLELSEFKSAGYSPETQRIETAEAMKAALNQNTWNLVISDHRMPHFSSFEALEILKQTGLDIPFIVVSGTIGEETAADLLKAGAYDYVMKQNLKRLKLAVEHGLANAQERQKRREIENRLRENELKYRMLFENSGSAVYILDRDGIFMLMNTYGASLFGGKPADFIGKSIFDLNSKAVAEEYYNSNRRIIESGIGRIYETTFDFPIGRKTMLTNEQVIKDPNGNNVALQSASIDITERKRAEEDLKESQEKFSRAFNFSPVGMAITHFKTQRFIEVNEKWAEILGYSPVEMLGHTTAELNIYADPNIRATLWQGLVEKGKIQNQEVVFLTKQGTSVLVLVSSEIVTLKGEKHAISTMIDITERRKIEKALIENESKLKEAQKMAHLGFWNWDVTTNAVEWSDEVYKIFQLDPKEFTPQIDSILALSPWLEDHQRDQELIKRAKETHLPGFYEQKFLRPDNSIGYYYSTFQGKYDENNELISIVGTVLDITERKQAEEERRRIHEYQEMDRLKNNLLSTVSHELRTPLAGIKGYSTLLIEYDKKLKEKQKKESLEAINRSSDRLAELIDRLLDMSRLDAGLLQLKKELIKPGDMIKRTLTEAKVRAPRYVFRSEIKGKLPNVMADSKRLHQVLDNIVENAIKYSQEGTEIVIRAETKQNEFQISISDQGIGMPAEELTKIFDRMYRIEQRLTIDPGGLGLGLSLCKALVEKHGGRIWAESQVGKGSTFHFTLPLKTQDTGE